MNYPQQIANLILDIIFPIRCIGCGRFSAKNKHDYVCKTCFVSIPINRSSECIGCKNRIFGGNTCFRCKKDFQIDQLLIVSDYKNRLLEKIIKSLKYRFIREMAHPLGALIKKYVSRLAKDRKFNIFASNPLIVPIPLHYRRSNYRGFNQAELIAQIIAEATLNKSNADYLLRTKKAKSQVDMESKEERLKNIKDVFKVPSTASKQLSDKTIILIDDICTSGATLNEAAKVLKENGVKKVIGLVVARG